jgi:hypothetical protein
VIVRQLKSVTAAQSALSKKVDWHGLARSASVHRTKSPTVAWQAGSVGNAATHFCSLQATVTAAPLGHDGLAPYPPNWQAPKSHSSCCCARDSAATSAFVSDLTITFEQSSPLLPHPAKATSETNVIRARAISPPPSTVYGLNSLRYPLPHENSAAQSEADLSQAPIKASSMHASNWPTVSEQLGAICWNPLTHADWLGGVSSVSPQAATRRPLP